MKHNYEKKNSILILTVILVVIELISFIRSFFLICITLWKDNAILYEIIEDKGLISEKYYQILLKMKTPSTKEQIIELSVKLKKQNILSTIKSLWKGEINWKK